MNSIMRAIAKNPKRFANCVYISVSLFYIGGQLLRILPESNLVSLFSWVFGMVVQASLVVGFVGSAALLKSAKKYPNCRRPGYSVLALTSIFIVFILVTLFTIPITLEHIRRPKYHTEVIIFGSQDGLQSDKVSDKQKSMYASTLYRMTDEIHTYINSDGEEITYEPTGEDREALQLEREADLLIQGTWRNAIFPCVIYVLAIVAFTAILKKAHVP